MTKFFIKKRVTTLMLVLIVMLGGSIAYSALELAYYPNMDLPVALVMTTYTGAGPEEMEDLVTKPLEESLATLTGIDKMTSQSSAGTSMVALQFVDGTNIDNAVNDMREKVDLVKSNLPKDAKEPTIVKMDLTSTNIEVGVMSEKYDSQTLYELLDNNVSKYFERVSGVASVSLSGGAEREVRVTVDQDKLNNYGITTSTISSVLSTENANTPTGSLDEGEIALQMRAYGQFETLDDIRNLYITTKSGNTVLLKDIAEVEEVYKEETNVTYIDGKEGCMYTLSKASDGNIVTVTDNILKAIADINNLYPELNFQVMTTTSDYIKLSVSNIVSTAFQSSILAMLVLLFFLRDWKTSVVIGVSIPTSMFATFCLMYVTGMTLNMVSMGGVVIAIGMLVDNSVVVLENIFRHSKEGESPREAAYNGTTEVTMAIVASTLTSVAVFGPMIFVKGVMGQMLSNISYTIVFALLASLVVSITFVPMASALVMSLGGKRSIFAPIGEKLGKLLDKFDAGYGKVLKKALNHRFLTVGLTLAVFVITLMLSSNVGQNLMDRGDQGVVEVSAELPNGSNLESCERILNQMLDRIGEIPEQKSMFATAGAGGTIFTTGSSTATITYNLVDKEKRDRSSDEVKEEIEKKLVDISGAEITVSTSASAMGSIGDSGFSFNIYADDLSELRRINEDIQLQLKDAGAVNVESTMDKSVPEASIKIDRAKAAKYGVTTGMIANAVSVANNGSKSTEYKENGTELDVVIKYPEEQIKYVKDLNNITITTQKGVVIPITEVASIEMSQTATKIRRENQRRFTDIKGEFTGLDTAEQKRKVKEILDNYMWPSNTNYEFGGVIEMMEDTFRDLGLALLVAVLLVYMIMASQFESFINPFILMFSMPISITGGILGLLVTGKNITSSVFMGFILLVGMVVNNGIVLVDYANQMRERHNIGAKEAMLMSGPARLRPILMTTLTTVLGMVPMALAIGSGMESMQPMGIAIIFGLSASTLLTLIFIPTLYCITDSIIRGVKRLFRGKPKKNGVKFTEEATYEVKEVKEEGYFTEGEDSASNSEQEEEEKQ
ncbi:MAG: efflux RND transporter permease subunit [Firmicutes bacterium]|nr:efflux RND transporter permease subunit [Bacillota bacterium]